MTKKAREIKELEKRFAAERRASEPHLFERRELILGLIISWLGIRTLYVILSTLHAVLIGIPLVELEISMQIAPLIAGYLFAHSIYARGARALAYLLLIGGIWSIFIGHRDEVVPLLMLALRHGNLVFAGLIIMFMAGMTLQIFTMVFIILDNKCKLYTKTMADIRLEAVTAYRK